MIAPIHKKIVLIGGMACGKSTIGKLLSKKLCYAFKDSDRLIELKQSQSIADIFKQHGEPFFRDCEKNIIDDLIHSPQIMVIATGGGAILIEQTRQLFKSTATVIYLYADNETLAARSQHSHKRPLLFQKDHQHVLTEMMQVRHPLYKTAANHIISTESGDTTQAVFEIMQALNP